MKLLVYWLHSFVIEACWLAQTFLFQYWYHDSCQDENRWRFVLNKLLHFLEITFIWCGFCFVWWQESKSSNKEERISVKSFNLTWEKPKFCQNRFTYHFHIFRMRWLPVPIDSLVLVPFHLQFGNLQNKKKIQIS